MFLQASFYNWASHKIGKLKPKKKICIMKYYSSDPTSWSKTHTLYLDNIAKEAFVYIMKAINFKPWQRRRTIYAQHYELRCRRWELCMGSVVSLWGLRDTVNIYRMWHHWGSVTTPDGMLQDVRVTRFDQSECVICRVIFAFGKSRFQRCIW